MIISPPFLPEQGSAGHADDNAYVDSAMLDSLQLSTAAGGAPGGSYPLGGALTWHNGVHLRAPSDAQGRGRLPVRAIADGTVIFKRSPKSTNQDATDPQNYNPFGTEPAWTDNGIVIIRHTTDIGATGDTPTSVTYYSVYMHLSSIDATVVESKPIWRKDKIGQAGQIFGEAHQIHFEICMDAANLQALVGCTRPITLTEPNAPPTANGRTDAVFGSVYIHLPAGTPTSETEPTHHLGRPTAGASAATDHFVPNTLRVAQWVEIRYQNGQGTVSSYRATDRKDAFKVGDPIGQPHVEPDFEYDMYTEANKRHNSLPSTVQSNSSPSGWYELLRFGRNIGPDRLPADAAHWRQIPTDTGTVWADLNADGTHVFSDADFPAFKGWQCFDDDATQEDQRCDSIELKRLVRDPQVPESIRERKALARRLGRPDVRERLKRAICRFPTEWDKATIAQRYDWLKVDEEFKIDEGEAWDKFKAHCEAISFDDLPQEYKDAVWHFHPRMFIAHMRLCNWLGTTELARALKAAPSEGRSRANSLRTPMNMVLRKYGIAKSQLRMAHFLAQVGHETGWWQYRRELGNERYFRTMYEIITIDEAKADYRSGFAKRLGLVKVEVSAKTGAKVDETEKKYGDRRPGVVAKKAIGLGNGSNAPGGQVGDGQRFRGRGFLQITGRKNYRMYGEFRGRDFTSTDSSADSLAAVDLNAFDASGYYWARENANSTADIDSAPGTITKVGGIVNRGSKSLVPLHNTERQKVFVEIFDGVNDES